MKGLFSVLLNIPIVSVIIPALNEEGSLPYVLRAIPDWVSEVILVDGGSTDNTILVASQTLPSVKIVQQEGKGKGAAIRSGFNAATGDIIVMLDADGSTHPDEIVYFVQALMNGAGYAKGSRFMGRYSGSSDMTALHWVGNAVLVMTANILFGSRFTDITYGYNATWRYNQHKLALEIDGWANEIINNIRAYRNKLKVVEVPSFERSRIAGDAKLRAWSAGWSILKAIFRERINFSHINSVREVRNVF